MSDFRLTQKQIDRLRSLDDWEEDWEGTLKLIHSFGIDLIEWDLAWFMDKFLIEEQWRLWRESDAEWHRKYEERKGKHAGYSSATEPVVGNKYHLTWAHRGCVWILKEVLPNGKCKLMTPKTKKILTANTADLLNLRNK